MRKTMAQIGCSRGPGSGYVSQETKTLGSSGVCFRYRKRFPAANSMSRSFWTRHWLWIVFISRKFGYNAIIKGQYTHRKKMHKMYSYIYDINIIKMLLIFLSTEISNKPDFCCYRKLVVLDFGKHSKDNIDIDYSAEPYNILSIIGSSTLPKVSCCKADSNKMEELQYININCVDFWRHLSGRNDAKDEHCRLIG